MPKEPRQGPTVLGRVHQRICARPSGSVFCYISPVYPNLIHFGFFTIPTLGLLAAIGLMAALALSLKTAAIAGLSPDRVWSAGTFTIIAAFVLSRLLLVVTNLSSFIAYPILLLMVPSLTPLGLLLTAIATVVYLRLRGLDLLPTLDAWAPCATLAWAFFALGHFAEGSDPGLPSNLPWAVHVTASSLRLQPVALYAALVALAITAVLLRLPMQQHRGYTFALGLLLSGLAQFLLTFLRQPDIAEGAFGNLLDPIQWVALGMMVAAAVVWLQPRKQVADAV